MRTPRSIAMFFRKLPKAHESDLLRKANQGFREGDSETSWLQRQLAIDDLRDGRVIATQSPKMTAFKSVLAALIPAGLTLIFAVGFWVWLLDHQRTPLSGGEWLLFIVAYLIIVAACWSIGHVAYRLSTPKDPILIVDRRRGVLEHLQHEWQCNFEPSATIILREHDVDRSAQGQPKRPQTLRQVCLQPTSESGELYMLWTYSTPWRYRITEAKRLAEMMGIAFVDARGPDADSLGHPTSRLARAVAQRTRMADRSRPRRGRRGSPRRSD